MAGCGPMCRPRLFGPRFDLASLALGESSLILLQNATLVDGTGAPPRPGNLLIRDTTIAEVGPVDAPGASMAIHCRIAASLSPI